LQGQGMGGEDNDDEYDDGEVDNDEYNDFDDKN
jgi:hypothetical protein